jgi:iron(III) transport system permease protein
MSGARGLRTLARVVLPMTLPALLSAITLAVIIIASGFETPILIGLPAGVSTYISLLYETVSSPTVQLNFAASQGCIYLLLTLTLMTCYLTATKNERKFVTITGRGNQAIQLARPAVRRLLIAVVVVYFFVAFVMPLCITLLTSFLHFYSAVNGNPFHNFTLSNYRQVFGTPTLVSAVETSTLLAVLACAIVVFVALVFAIIAWKTHGRLRRACEAIAMAPIAVPALVYSIALFLTVLAVPGLSQHLYGSRFVMLVAEAIIFLPLAMRLMAGAVIQVSDDLIDAARASGATFFRSMCSIVVPIVRPAVLYAASVVIVLSYRELAAIVFLVATNTTVVPYASFTAWVSGGYPLLSALNVITMLVPIALVVLVLGCARGSRLSRLLGSRTMRVRRESMAVSR